MADRREGEVAAIVEKLFLELVAAGLDEAAARQSAEDMARHYDIVEEPQ